MELVYRVEISETRPEVEKVVRVTLRADDLIKMVRARVLPTLNLDEDIKEVVLVRYHI